MNSGDIQQPIDWISLCNSIAQGRFRSNIKWKRTKHNAYCIRRYLCQVL